MSHRYQLIDMQTFEPVGAYDEFEEIERILRSDLEHNGPESVRNLELFVGTEETPESIVSGEELLELTSRLTPAKVISVPSKLPGVPSSKRAGR